MIDKNQIRFFIQDEIMKEGSLDNFEDSDSLVETGIIDSLGIQILLAFLEQTYSVHISDDELIPENFETIEAISEFVSRKISKSGS